MSRSKVKVEVLPAREAGTRIPTCVRAMVENAAKVVPS